MQALTRRLLLVVADALLLNAGVLLALLIRFEGHLPRDLLADYTGVAIPFTVLSLVAFYVAGFYSSLWRYASMDEMFVILKGTLLSTGVLAALVYGLPAIGTSFPWPAMVPAIGFPRSVVILTWLLTTTLTGGLRFSYRFGRRLLQMWREQRRFLRRLGSDATRRRVLIVGAGEAGALVVRELTQHAALGYEPVGLVDDDPGKQHLRVHGFPVLGTRQDLPAIIDRLYVDEVVIAMPSVPGHVVREIVSSIRDLRVKIKTLPGMYELINGTVNIHQIREVQIEDLLGREPVNVDLEQIAGYLRDEKVLVTGAGGSIGSELCRQIARFEPAALLLLDHSENGLFETSLDLRHQFPCLQQQVLVADIREQQKIDSLLAQHRPDVIFHAAAHKHVPLMEAHPDEAVKTNIFGTKNVAEGALRCGAKRFVLISTDKAVNPVSVMGATKRVAEMVIQALDAERRRQDPAGTRFVAVRFGNVLGSRGSVVPIFKEQIARGGPVTVTHPDMRRYFMTIPEAVQLVIQAGAMGDGGEIFILDMGEPVRIVDLAENLIRLSGFEPGVDIAIEFTGARPGEKLFEELLTAEEDTATTRHRRIFVGQIAGVEPGWLESHLNGLHYVLKRETGAVQIVFKLAELVPFLRSAQAAEVAAGKHVPDASSAKAAGGHAG